MTKERKIQILKNKIEYCESKNIHKNILKKLKRELEVLI